MSKRFLTKFLSLVIALQSLTLCADENFYTSLPEGYANCTNKIDVQTEQLLSKINQQPPAFRKTSLKEWERFAKEEPSTATPHPNVSIENIFIEGPNGQLGLRIYRPKSEELLPVFIFFHGGGWTAGSLNQYDYFCQEICDQTKCLLVSVDYGQAPRYTYPQPLEDCVFAVEWIEKHIKDYGGDVTRIAVGGDSAGGNLAAAVTIKERVNQKSLFLCQVLICPALNYNFDTLSYYEFSDGYFISREDMKFFWGNYLAQAQTQEKKNAFISPLQADSLSGLPPALLIIANFDPLRDEGLAYSLRLFRDGVPTHIKRFNSIHGFYAFQELDVSKEAITAISIYLSEAFAKDLNNTNKKRSSVQ